MRSFTLHQCWITICIIGAVLLAFPGRYRVPAGGGHPEVRAVKRHSFVVEIAGGVARPGIYSFSRAVNGDEAVREAGGLEGGAGLCPECGRRVLTNGSVLSIGGNGCCSADTLMDAHKRFLFFVPFAVNEAGVEELMLVPGIGEKTARTIVAYRDRHGCFPQLEALLRVPGVGPRTFRLMKDFLVL